MRNLYLIQPSSTLSNSVFLPYSVGSIAAYSFKDEAIRNNYTLCDFVFMKSHIDEIIEEMNVPSIAGFSCYMWNVEYNLVFAKKIKEKWPDCTIIFGGPQIPDSKEYLENYDYIDIVIHGEGEVPFYSILMEELRDRDFSKIANISYRTQTTIEKTKKEKPCNLEDLPSPYEVGLFDSIINNEKYSSFTFDAVIETNRGCPYGCVYCYWARSGSDFRQFPIERVEKDIEWIAKNKISYCICADSNFGMLDRDEKIAEYVVEMKKKYGFPDIFETASAKNKNELTFKINYNLEQQKLNRGVSVAVQSMSPKVLEIIGRKNMPIENFILQLEKYRTHNMHAYTELILGLPGETKESFCKGLFDVMEAGQHYAISVHRCEVFPNTPIYSKEMREKYKIKTITSQLCQKHSRIDADLTFASRSQIIVETNTMSMSDWYATQKIAICAQSFHCMGLLRFFAIYLRKTKNLPYYDFYMNLYDWIEHESVDVKRILDKTCSTFEAFFKGEGNLYFADERFGNIYWDFDDGMFLSCAAECDVFYADVKNYLKSYFEDDALFEDLLKYQKEMIALPFRDEKELHTEYDWYNYFEHTFDVSFTEPEQKNTVLKIEKSSSQTWEDYARKAVWYGKRNGNMLNKIIRAPHALRSGTLL